MPDYSRIASLVRSTVWFIEPRRGQAMADAFLNRLEMGPRRDAFLSEAEVEAKRNRAAVRRQPMPPQGQTNRVRDLAIIPLIGAILPRGDSMEEMSGGGAVNVTRFMREFEQVATDETVGAILLEIDSPGGDVSLVAEAAGLVRKYRKKGRPIVAIANTMAASAAYWIAAAADEVVVTPSGVVGSIGVFQLHQDLQGMAEMMGVVPRYIFEGPRKVEGNPFEDMDDAALAAFQSEVRAYYEMFTNDIAEFRGVDVSVVRSDPEAGGRSFGGGRAYSASQLRGLKLNGRKGMVDRVETLRDTVERLMGAGTSGASRRRAAATRLALTTRRM